METEYTISENEYVKANKLFTKPSKKLLVVYCLLITALLLIALCFTNYILRFAAIGAIIGGIIGNILSRYVFAPVQTRKQYRVYQAAQESVIISAKPEGINFRNSSGESIIEWNKINKWRENNEFLLIYQAPQVYNIIPKRIGVVSQNIRELLQQNIGNAV